MARYFPINLDFEPWEGSDQPVFREKTTSHFSADEIRQDGPAEGSGRQAHFERQLLRMAEVTPDGRLPVFSQWNDKKKRRMDLGCIGHSLRRGFIEQPVDDRVLRYVTHIKLKTA
jgi:hypothetical protein